MIRKTTIYRLFLWGVTLAWAGAICSLSLQTAPQSAALSSGLTARILNLFERYTALPESERLAVLAQAQSVVRELAHVAEYAILGLSTALLVHSYRVVRFGCVAFGATAVFAVVDECLQEFVSVGRAFQAVDLLKDWVGAALGIGCIWLVSFLSKRKNCLRK